MAEENRPMSIEMDGETQMMRPEEIEKMTSQGGSMPMMSEEEKQIFTNLLNRGVPEDMIIEIMASAKVGESVADMSSAIRPEEFGGLPKTGSSPASGNPSIPTVGGTGAVAGAGMNQNDMANYLQNKVMEIRSRTGGTGGGATTPAMGALPMPSPANVPPSLGADRTFNPRDRITPTNAPST